MFGVKLMFSFKALRFYCKYQNAFDAQGIEIVWESFDDLFAILVVASSNPQFF